MLVSIISMMDRWFTPKSHFKTLSVLFKAIRSSRMKLWSPDWTQLRFQHHIWLCVHCTEHCFVQRLLNHYTPQETWNSSKIMHMCGFWITWIHVCFVINHLRSLATTQWQYCQFIVLPLKYHEVPCIHTNSTFFSFWFRKQLFRHQIQILSIL